MKKKKILLILIFVTLTNCGYNSIYSNNKSVNINVSKIEKEGDLKINRRLLSLLNIVQKEYSEKSYLLNVDSSKKREIVAKDNTGNASIYKISIAIKITMYDSADKSKIFKSRLFESSFSYNTKENKFQLSQDEKNIENNLIESLAEKIIIYLYS